MVSGRPLVPSQVARVPPALPSISPLLLPAAPVTGTPAQVRRTLPAPVSARRRTLPPPLYSGGAVPSLLMMGDGGGTDRPRLSALPAPAPRLNGIIGRQTRAVDGRERSDNGLPPRRSAGAGDRKGEGDDNDPLPLMTCPPRYRAGSGSPPEKCLQRANSAVSAFPQNFPRPLLEVEGILLINI